MSLLEKRRIALYKSDQQNLTGPQDTEHVLQRAHPVKVQVGLKTERMCKCFQLQALLFSQHQQKYILFWIWLRGGTAMLAGRVGELAGCVRVTRVCVCVCMWIEASQIVDPAFSSCFCAEKFSVNSQPLPFSTSKAVQQQRSLLHRATLSFPPCSTKQHHCHFAHISTHLCFYCLGFCRGHLPYHWMAALL